MQRRKKLVIWRYDKKLKQREVSKALNISVGHYSNIERGKTDPSFEVLMRFRKVYPEKDILGLFEKEKSVWRH